jgi:TolA-binding protein
LSKVLRPDRWVALHPKAAAAFLAAAAVLVAWVGWDTQHETALVRVQNGELTVESMHGATRLVRDGLWDQGDDVVVSTQRVEASLGLPSQASVRLGPGTRAEIRRQRESASDDTEAQVEVVRLKQGSVNLDVPKLSHTQRLYVVTEQAKVVVRGTLFAVSINRSSTGLSFTKVTVEEGTVSAFMDGREHRISAGQSWSSSDEQSSDATSADETASAAEPSVASTLGGGTDNGAVAADAGGNEKRRSGTAPKDGTSPLAQQNRLFESAQAARRSGQPDTALRRFEELMRSYPGSEQAHNARVQHFRLLRSLGRTQAARRSAQAYLRAYPRGFARTEAEQLTR